MRVFKLVLLFGILAICFGCNYLGFGDAINENTDPKVAVQTALRNFLNAKSYNSVVKTKNADISVETEVDFISPAKYWIRNNLPGRANETIAIGNDSYSRINIGKWTKSTSNDETSFANTRIKMTEESLSAMKDFVLVGKETFNNGKEVFVYTFNSSTSTESSSKMWVDAKKVLPLRVDTKGTYNGSNIEMSIIYDFDKEIKIEPPIMD